MKFIKISESNAHGNPNLYEFHIGIKEIELLEGVLKNYTIHCPIGKRWLPDNMRARNMLKTIEKLND